MYPNSHLRWASPSIHFVHQEGVIKTPAYKRLALVGVLLATVLLGGTAQALKMAASKQATYQPAAAAPVPQASPPASQPAF
jgi:hypothetical protein